MKKLKISIILISIILFSVLASSSFSNLKMVAVAAEDDLEFENVTDANFDSVGARTAIVMTVEKAYQLEIVGDDIHFYNELDNLYTSDWQKKCFLEYGIKPKVVTDENSEVLSFDVVADFDNIKNKTLFVEFLGKTRTIYPDCEYLKISDELKFLRNFELEDSTICAVFGQNNSLLTDSNVCDKMIKN